MVRPVTVVLPVPPLPATAIFNPNYLPFQPAGRYPCPEMFFLNSSSFAVRTGNSSIRVCGKKSAATVLRHYVHVDAIPDSADDWDVSVRGAAGLAKSLAEHRDDAALWVELATLRRDAPIEESLSDLQWRGARRAELEALYEELGFGGDELNRIGTWRDGE